METSTHGGFKRHELKGLPPYGKVVTTVKDTREVVELRQKSACYTLVALTILALTAAAVGGVFFSHPGCFQMLEYPLLGGTFELTALTFVVSSVILVLRQRQLSKVCRQKVQKVKAEQILANALLEMFQKMTLGEIQGYFHTAQKETKQKIVTALYKTIFNKEYQEITNENLHVVQALVQSYGDITRSLNEEFQTMKRTGAPITEVPSLHHDFILKMLEAGVTVEDVEKVMDLNNPPSETFYEKYARYPEFVARMGVTTWSNSLVHVIRAKMTEDEQLRFQSELQNIHDQAFDLAQQGKAIIKKGVAELLTLFYTPQFKLSDEAIEMLGDCGHLRFIKEFYGPMSLEEKRAFLAEFRGTLRSTMNASFLTWAQKEIQKPRMNLIYQWFNTSRPEDSVIYDYLKRALLQKLHDKAFCSKNLVTQEHKLQVAYLLQTYPAYAPRQLSYEAQLLLVAKGLVSESYLEAVRYPEEEAELRYFATAPDVVASLAETRPEEFTTERVMKIYTLMSSDQRRAFISAVKQKEQFQQALQQFHNRVFDSSHPQHVAITKEENASLLELLVAFYTPKFQLSHEVIKKMGGYGVLKEMEEFYAAFSLEEKSAFLADFDGTLESAVNPTLLAWAQKEIQKPGMNLLYRRLSEVNKKDFMNPHTMLTRDLLQRLHDEAFSSEKPATLEHKLKIIELLSFCDLIQYSCEARVMLVAKGLYPSHSSHYLLIDYLSTLKDKKELIHFATYPEVMAQLVSYRSLEVDQVVEIYKLMTTLQRGSFMAEINQYLDTTQGELSADLMQKLISLASLSQEQGGDIVRANLHLKVRREVLAALQQKGPSYTRLHTPAEIVELAHAHPETYSSNTVIEFFTAQDLNGKIEFLQALQKQQSPRKEIIRAVIAAILLAPEWIEKADLQKLITFWPQDLGEILFNCRQYFFTSTNQSLLEQIWQKATTDQKEILVKTIEKKYSVLMESFDNLQEALLQEMENLMQPQSRGSISSIFARVFSRVPGISTPLLQMVKKHYREAYMSLFRILQGMGEKEQEAFFKLFYAQQKDICSDYVSSIMTHSGTSFTLLPYFRVCPKGLAPLLKKKIDLHMVLEVLAESPKLCEALTDKAQLEALAKLLQEKLKGNKEQRYQELAQAFIQHATNKKWKNLFDGENWKGLRGAAELKSA